MPQSVGFYDPEESRDSEGESGGRDSLAKLFVALTDRTGWTPKQIGELTLKQIKEYVRIWKGESEIATPTYEDMQTFNFTSGIKTVKIKRDLAS